MSLLAARAKGLAWGCGVQAAALGWLLLVCSAFALTSPSLPRDARPWAVFLALGTWAGTTLPAVIIGGIVMSRRRNATLDRAFEGLGPGRAIGPVARGWSCLVNGREVNAWFSRAPQIELYVSARTKTQAEFARPGAGSHVAGALSWANGLVARAADAEWITAFVESPGVADTLGALLPEGDGARRLQVLPDSVKYTWRGLNLDELTDESVGMLIDRLDGLARAADRVPAPATPAAPGLASKLRTNRGSLGSFLALVLGVVTIVVVLSAAIAALVIGASWH